MKAALFAAAALAPLSLSVGLCLASAAQAQTTVNTGSRTTAVQTSTINNGQPANINVEAGSVVGPSAAGSAVTIDSNNTVTNVGVITFNDLNDVVGVRLTGGFTGSLTNSGAINLLEGYTPTDSDSDGDLDGVFAQGARRIAILVSGASPFTGNISLTGGSFLNVEGTDSAGVSVQTQLTGAISNLGTITVFGDRSVGVLVNAPITGDVRSTGIVSATGAGSQAMALNGAIGGAVVIQNQLNASGYRFVTRPPLPTTRAALDSDDLLQGGSALTVGANVAGGVLIDAAPIDRDTADSDEDDDGTLDASEARGLVRSFGAAPALNIGSATGAVTLGSVGTGANAYGLVIRGTVGGDGVYDGVAATGIRVGQTGGGATTLQGGLSVGEGGVVNATAYAADATGIRIGSGANVATLDNAGGVGAVALTELASAVTAIDIAAGATVTTLRNSGALTAEGVGERAVVSALIDRSGTLAMIQNTGTIAALLTPTDDALDTDDANSDPADEIIAGRRIALDLSANTTGVLLTQSGRMDSDTGTDTDGDGVEDIDEPFISGAILLGSGDDRVLALNGAITGDISFGAGADQLTVGGGATVTGAITDTDGRLGVDVQNGQLAITNTGTINATSLNVGTDGAIVFTTDANSTATLLNVSGAATIATGAQVGVRLNALQRTAQEYRVLTAGTLSVGTLDTSLLGQAPYLYIVNTRVDQGANTLFIGVRPRTVAELDFNQSETDAFAGVFDSLDQNDRIEAAVLSQTTREGLVRIYDQLLPDHSGGALLSLAAVNDALANVLGSRTEPRGRVGPNGAWVQEVFFDLRQDRNNALGFESRGFGVTGGLEGVGPDGGAIGVTASFVTADYEDTDAVIGEQVSFSMFELGGYWRRQWGGLRFDARLAGGVVLFDSDRRLISAADNLALTTEADWLGYSASGHAGVSYEVGGRFYARPFAALDGVYLHESSYEEEGGGAGFDLEVDSRSGGLLSASGGVTVGARFGRETWFGPELTVGYRAPVAGEPGSTTARFRGRTAAFTLDPEDVDGGGLQIRIALRAGSNRGYIALETGGEVRDDYARYDIRIVAKLIF